MEDILVRETSISKATGVWAPLANSEESKGEVFKLALGNSNVHLLDSNRTPNPVDEFIYPTGSTNYSTLLNTPVDSEVDNTNGKTWEYQNFQSFSL